MNKLISSTPKVAGKMFSQWYNTFPTCIDRTVPLNQFLALQNPSYQIGIFLHFLCEHNLGLTIRHNYFDVYFLDINKVDKTFKDYFLEEGDMYLIKQRNNNTSWTETAIDAILYSLTYLAS